MVKAARVSPVSVGLVLLAIAALTVAPFGTAATTHATSFPVHGLVVPGRSLGSLTLGMSELAVTTRWGRSYSVCAAGCGKTPLLTWLYEYRGPEPLGAAVRFLNGKVVAIFTLGSPVGWGLKGLMMGDPISNVYSIFGNPGTSNCVGYTALTERIGNATTAVYSASGVVYGYALTAPSVSPCQ